MSQKHRRYTLKTKEAKQILAQASQKLHLNLENTFGIEPDIETVETGIGEIILINQKPMLHKTGKSVLPTLLAAEILTQLPKIVVDMGAISHVCNGADIMAPGIVRIEGEFNKGNIVLVTDEKYAKPIAIGETILNSAEAKTTKKGTVVKNLHYVGDKIWDVTKTMTQ